MSFNDLEQGNGVFKSSRNDRQPEGAIQLPDDDDEREYRTIVQGLLQKAFRINGNNITIERLTGFLGGPNDTPDVRNNLHSLTETTRDIIKDSTNDIKALAYYQSIDDHQSRHRKSEQQKLSKDFQKVVGDFQRIQHVLVNKQREYVNKTKATTTMLQSQAAADEEEDGILLKDQFTFGDNAQRRLQLQTLDNEIGYNELLISEREGEIQGIEQGIVELNEIFRDLGMLVNEQDSNIQSIYGNVINIAQNTRQAADELTTANRHQKNSRKSVCCFLLIVSIVASIFALIIVVA